MNELKKIFLGLTASTVVLSTFAFSALPSRAQADAPEEGGPEQIAMHQEVDAPEGEGPADCCGPWAEKLGLSDDQMEKLVSLKSEYMVKTAQQKAELMADMKKMILLMTDSQVDKSAIKSLHDKMSSIKSDLGTARVNHMIEAMEVLTSKQRSEIRHHILVHMSSPHHMHGMQHHGKWHHHE